MARQAAKWLSSGVRNRHATAELPLVNVLMATGATELVEMVERHAGTGRRFVAFIAGHRLMSPRERETGLLVFCKSVAGGIEGSPGVALFTAIVPWSRRELASVLILMTIDAQAKADFEACILAGRNMAVGAFDLGMRRHKREAGLRMIRRCKRGRSPAFYLVATLATPTVGALQELSAMRIGIVAIRAIGKGYGRLEVGIPMASHTRHFDVFAQQREFRLRVIECRGECGLLPRRGRVATLASLFEFALVGIGMA